MEPAQYSSNNLTRVKTDDGTQAGSGAVAAAVTYRTIPAAIFVKPYAVEQFNYWSDRLADGTIDEDTHGEILLERVRQREGVTSSWESIEIEPTGQWDGYLVEVVVAHTGGKSLRKVS